MVYFLVGILILVILLWSIIKLPKKFKESMMLDIAFLFIIFFAYFYASIVFNAKDISENLKKQGGFIPGIRPGEGTALFLNEVASRLTLWGSIYLGLISTLPWVLVKVMGVPFYFGGTAVLIVVQVALDTMRKIEAQMYMNKYETLSAVGL